ncbi:MAG: alginate export family protein [Verrucomicrobia bacterium]|nr:MAG: alginate export family protein [Verrucomicrobiota bacterium]PYJ99347.1 MAG: alginate export family protein [Verrucomicrobiota bacterium]
MTHNSNGKHQLWLLVMGMAVCRTASGQSTDSTLPTSAPPFKQLRYDENYEYLRDPSRRADYLDAIKFIPLNPNGDWYLTPGGEIRERYEYYHNSLWGRGPQDDNGYLLQRYMVHADAHFGDYFRIFTQFKSGLEDGRNGGPRPTDRDDVDLNQAFFDVRVPLVEADSLIFRGGRQELAYGSSRLISAREAPNVRLSFDGVKAILNVSGWRVDAFAVKPVRTKTGVFDDDPDPNQKFWGLYAVTPVSWLQGGNVDLYYLGLDRNNAHFDQGTAHEIRHSVGTRIWGRKAGWDYNFEFVYQVGSFGNGDIQAWTAASDVGFTFENTALKPRLGLKANVTSGDDNPNNSDLQTFNPLFPKGAYFGEPALIGPANHIDVHPQLDLAFRKNVTLTLDWDCFWRESARDGIYGPAVNVIQSGQNGNARYVGNQVEAMLEWQLDRHLTLAADYAHFFAGDFLKQTTPGRDVDYFSAWVTYRF